MTLHYLLDFARSIAILLNVGHKLVGAVASGFQHCGHCALRRVRHARREGVKEHVAEGGAKARNIISVFKRLIMTLIEFIGNASHCNALACVTEYFRRAHKHNIVVGVVRHASHVRRLERRAQILTEVHCHIRKVLNHNNVVLCGKAADDFQLLVVQAHPRRVVRARIEHRADVALLEVTLDFSFEFVAAEIGNVERRHLDTDNARLHFLHGESWVDVEHGVLLRVELRAEHKRRE